VIFCGINPAMSAALSGHHFSSGSNRFWRVLHLAGFTPHLICAEDDRSIIHYRCGLTAAVAKPTVRAGDLRRADFVASRRELEHKVRHYRPRFLAFLGKPAFSAMYAKRRVEWGRQDVQIGSSGVWVLPNPSGLNRAFTLSALVTAYSKLRKAIC
jgi:G:T/U mismatch-specific DNA glycosylase